MTRVTVIAAAIAVAAAAHPIITLAADENELKQIRDEMRATKEAYEERIRKLEQRLEKAEQTPAPAASPASSGSSSASAFNPAISLILGGHYANLQRDPDTFHIGGFIPSGGEVGPGSRSFNLGESELTVSANIDPYFSGKFVAAVTPENEVEVEEGFVQNTGALSGLTIKFGRFLSGFGYLNEVHAHAWDFVDAPLAYQAFFGGALKEDGIQARWLAPTPMFLEFGVESGRGANFPGSERNKNGLNSWMLFAHLGDDIGVSHSYRIGASYRVNRPQDREFEDVDALGNTVTNAFSGKSKIWGVDFVWKWAPNGNSTEQNFKFQAEYLRRNEDGTLAFDTAGANVSDSYRSSQSGWYVQGAYQFMPRWRFGLRYDRLSSGTSDIGLVNNGTQSAADFPLLAQYSPKRATAMIDFSPSEFSRLRLQFARDQSRFSEADNQIFLQYIMSLGAHGAHAF